MFVSIDFKDREEKKKERKRKRNVERRRNSRTYVYHEDLHNGGRP